MPETAVPATAAGIDTADATAKGQPVRFVTVVLPEEPDSSFAAMAVEHLALQSEGIAQRTAEGFQIVSHRLPDVPPEFAASGTAPLDLEGSADPAVAIAAAGEKALRRARKAAQKARG